MGELRTVARSAEIPTGSAVAVEIGSARVAVFNVGGTFFAIGDTCPHSGGPLSEGDVEGTDVVCPWHGATFSLIDGSVKCPPADEGVRSYRVHVEGGLVKVEVP